MHFSLSMKTQILIISLFNRNISSKKYGPCFIFSVKLTLCMEIISASMRLLSSFLWIQMYRLGASSADNNNYRDPDFDLRNSFLNPSSHEIDRQHTVADDFLGGAIYDPAYYSSLFEDAEDNDRAYAVFFFFCPFVPNLLYYLVSGIKFACILT